MYLNNWIQCLEENESAIWKASSLAKRGYMYCRDTTTTNKCNQGGSIMGDRVSIQFVQEVESWNEKRQTTY